MEKEETDVELFIIQFKSVVRQISYKRMQIKRYQSSLEYDDRFIDQRKPFWLLKEEIEVLERTLKYAREELKRIGYDDKRISELEYEANDENRWK